MQLYMYVWWVFLMQKCLLGSFETCLEAVSDFTELVNTLPEHISCKRTQHEAPPIIACEDRSIATAALSILKVSVYVFVYIHTYEAVLMFLYLTGTSTQTSGKAQEIFDR